MTTKPAWWLDVEAWLDRVTPAMLPPAPWVLKESKDGQSGGPLGGPYVTIHDSERFLAGLRRELGQGPTGPRGQVILEDLQALKGVLTSQEQERAKHGTAVPA
jgi:hypothetical protein